jgi:DNA-binding MarR family transcriptional regulator|nr:MarR family transcriptional regulator [uncultured Caldimonas sp.]
MPSPTAAPLHAIGAASHGNRDAGGCSPAPEDWPVTNGAKLAPGVLHSLRSFRLIVRSIKRHFQHVQDATGLSGSQLWCLSAVHTSPGMRVTQLARALGIQQATCSNLIETLERRGLIDRRRDPTDQRAVTLFLTPEGERIAQSAPEPVSGVLPDALSRLDPEALSELNLLLDRVIALMGARTAAISSA